MKMLLLTFKCATFLLVVSFFWDGSECERNQPNGDCEAGSFQCNSTDLCIPQRHWCDGEVHCDDSSDETSCNDAVQNELNNRMFRKRPGARDDELPATCNFDQPQTHNSSLNEHSNPTNPPPPPPPPPPTTTTTSVDTALTSATPAAAGNPWNSGCQCLQANIACRHLHLVVAPPIRKMYELAGKVVDLLDLGGNEFSQIAATTFENLKATRIKSLVLKHCGIKELAAHCFDDLLENGLEELHLDGNGLTRLHDKLFNVNSNVLRLLSIGHNLISTIDTDTFLYLDQLIELDMGKNKIENINANWFRTLYNLTTLNLQGNEITHIEISSWLATSPISERPDHFRLDVPRNKSASLPIAGNQSIRISPRATSRSGLIAKDYNWQDMRDAHEQTLLNDDEVIVDNEHEQGQQGLHKLGTLYLANNRIGWIQDDAFAAAPMAKTLINLDLSGNYITTLSNRTFKGLSNLLGLKLNQNYLRHIHANAFTWIPNLTSLDLQNNEESIIIPELFSPLTHLHHLYFVSFEMCAHAPLVKVCEPKGDGISSKEHLLDSIILRASVWIMALIGFIGNSIVLLGRQFVTRHSNAVDSLHIKNLAISDLLMSIYLFAIASVDEYYRGEYLLNEFNWRNSHLCTLSGFLNTLSCESSVLILSLVTWDRYVSVTRPFPRNQLSFKFVALRLVALWTIAAMIAILPVLQLTRGYFGFEFYNSNGVCLPLYLHNPYAKGWQYSIAMFVCINLSALFFIGYAYIRMIQAIRVSTVACRSTQQTHDRDRVAQHLGIIVFTDCMCWVPVIAIKMATLAGLELTQSYRNFVYASLAIYIMPINSALNPILYTFATPLFKKQLHKMAHMCCQRTRRPEGQSGYDTALSLSLGVVGSNGRRVLTYRSTQTSHTGSRNWRKQQPQAV